MVSNVTAAMNNSLSASTLLVKPPPPSAAETPLETERSSSAMEAKTIPPHNDCCICLCSLANQPNEQRNVVYIYPCSHNFHEDCLHGYKASRVIGTNTRWSASSWKCPICKTVIQDIQQTRVDFGQEPAESDDGSPSTDVSTLVGRLWIQNEKIVLKALTDLTKSNKRQVLLSGGIVVIIRVLERYPKHAAIVRTAFACLHCLLTAIRQHVNARELEPPQLDEIIAKAMWQHEDCVVHTNALACLLWLLRLRYGSTGLRVTGKDFSSTMSIIRPLFNSTAMRLQPGYEKSIMNLCVFLQYIIPRSREFKNVFVAHNGAGAIQDVMRSKIITDRKVLDALITTYSMVTK